MAARTQETSNEWGGVDYQGPSGIARTSVDDGQTTVLYLASHGQGHVLVWQTTFSSGAPPEAIESTLRVARLMAGAKPRVKWSGARG